MGQIKEGEERTILVANIRKVLQVALIDTSIEWTSPLGQQVKREIEHRLGDKDGFDLVSVCTLTATCACTVPVLHLGGGWVCTGPSSRFIELSTPKGRSVSAWAGGVIAAPLAGC